MARETIQMDSVEELITTEEDLRTLVDTTTRTSKYFNNKLGLKDILKRIFNLCLADGPTLAGNTFSAIQQKLNSLAAQTELILSALKTERNSKDSTEAWVQATLTQLIQSFKHPTEDSSNKQINKSIKVGSKSSTTLTSDQRKKSTKATT